MLEKKLQKYYTITDSIKEYKGYKVKPPEETIKTIESAFEKINLGVLYIPKKKQIFKGYFPFQAGAAILFPKDNKEMILLRSGGKGVTPILARASATAELIERFSAYGLARGNINHYLSIMKRHQIWKKKREGNVEIEKEFHFHPLGLSDIVPEKLRRKYMDMAKSVCYSLTRDKFFSYPEEFITYLEGSNGLASGNTKEEAIVHAICECIERLGAMYVLDNLPPHYNVISEESITHPTLKKLMKAVEASGLEFKMLDFSYLFDMPLILTIFDHPEWNYPTNPYTNVYCEFPKIIIGVDTDPQDAAMRCFTEIIQAAEPLSTAYTHYHEVQDKFMISKISLSVRLKNYLKTAYSVFQNGNQPLSVNLRKYLRSKHNKISIYDIKSIYDINHRIEIQRITKNLKKHKIEILLHNLTNPVLKFPVVRVILCGGEGYFSQIPLIGYRHIVLGTKNKKYRYSYLKSYTRQIIVQRPLDKILKDEHWCKKVTSQNELIKRIIANLCYTGIDPPLWGKTIDKFYFLGMLYLRVKDYERAKRCFYAALHTNFNELSSLLGIAYIFLKQGNLSEYKKIIEHIKAIDKSIDINGALKEFENPVIDPNPFEPCDLSCSQKSKPYLCRECYFNYVSENVFMRDIIDETKSLKNF